MSPATTTIEEQVMSATGLKPKEGEDRAKWLARLANAADTKLSDEDWAELPDEAQAWVNSAIEAKNEKKPVPDPNGEAATEDDTDDDEDTASEDSDTEVEPAPAPKAKRGRAKASKPEAEPKAKRARAQSESGAGDAFRRLCIKYPDATRQDLEAKFEKAGHKLADTSRVIIFKEFRKAQRFMKEGVA